MRRPLSLFSPIVALMLLTVAVLGVPNTARAADPAKGVTVTIDNFTFAPRQLTLAAGTEVTWINRDDIPHTIVSSGGPQSFKSPPLDTDDKFSMRFDRPGVYRYFCSIHPTMTATLTVR